MNVISYFKRFLASLLTAVVLITGMPLNAFAVTEGTETLTEIDEQEVSDLETNTTETVHIDAVCFPDDVFRQSITGYDTNENGILDKEELAAVTSLDLSWKNIENLKGIEYFSSLIQLICDGNQLSSLDVSNNTTLEDLSCSDNQRIIKGSSLDTQLLSGFDMNKASDWANATISGTIVTAKDALQPITYTYDCGKGYKKIFMLVPTLSDSEHVIRFDANGGSVSQDSKIVTSGKSYETLPSPTRSGYDFKSWYTADTGGEKITENTEVSLTDDQILYAQWVTLSSEKNAVTKSTDAESSNTEAVRAAQDEYVYFGNYYQSKVTDLELSSKLSELREDGVDYVTYNKEKYFVRYSNYEYSYYKCNSIRWKVLKDEGGYLLLMSEKVLDRLEFGGTKWSDCNIRSWLNNHFYNSAFSASEQKDIASTTLSTIVKPYPYGGEQPYYETTSDKVFLVTEDDMLNTAYGFSASKENDTSRIGVSSEYVKDIAKDIIDEETGGCVYLLRGPGYYSYGNFQSSEVRTGGRLASYYPTWSRGVRPAIRVSKSSPNLSTTEPVTKYPEVEKITLSNKSLVVAKGKNKTLTATVLPSDADDKTISWSSSDPSIASINKNGKIAGEKLGTVTITAKTSNGTKATCKVAVKASDIKYKIVYNLSGGKNHSSNPAIYYYNDKTITLKNPSRKGYTFKGWYTSSQYKKKITQIKKGTKGQVDLFAKWEIKTYSITYKLNGGKNNSGNQKTYTIKTGAVSLKNPSKTGYNFKGWYTTSDFKEDTKISKIPGDYLKNVTLYAKWTKKTYTVKFKGNGSTSGSISDFKLKYNVSGKLTANAFKRTGYTFKEWNTNANGKEGTVYKNKATIKNKNLTLYAQWKANTYSVSYVKNGTGVEGTMKNSSHTYNTAKKLTANAYTRTGYDFKGWNTKADGSGTSYNDKASVKNLTSTNGKTVTLYAIWAKKTYTVKFKGNNSTSGSMSDMTLTYDIAKKLTVNAYKRTGYTFTGWNTKADGRGTKYEDKGSVKNKNLTLYAQWKANTYEVAFLGNDSSTLSTMEAKTYKYGTTYKLPANTYTLENYEFVGWNTKSDGSGTAYKDQASIESLTSLNNASVALYAQWKKVSVTVSAISALREKFPSGSYWNHVATTNHNYDECNVEGCNDPNGTTGNPCAVHDGYVAQGQSDCNRFDGASQCMGFALKLASDMYGGSARDWPIDQKIIKAGDIITFYGAYGADATYGHTVFVIGVNGTNITVAECNVGGNNCLIRWDYSYDLSKTTNYILYSAPTEAK